MPNQRYVSVTPFLVPVEKSFDYIVPDQFSDRVNIGSMVVVPFGNRKIFGMVVRITDIPPKRKLKEIENIVDDFKTVSSDLLGLCLWISRMYLCPLNTVMESVFPFQKKMSKHGIDSEAFLNLQRRTVLEKNVTILDSAIEKIMKNDYAEFKRAPAQRRVLRVLIDEGGNITAGRLIKLSESSMATLKALEKKGCIIIDYMPRDMSPSGEADMIEDDFLLNPVQKNAFDNICRSLSPAEHKVFLLQGVTGSGKTEIYMQAVRCCIEQNKKVIILVPEIALGTQIISRFLRRFAGKIAVWHSRLSTTERLYEWNRITSGEVDIVIGARSAVFAPLDNIGLIIVDEEHEASYKQESTPRYNAREAAVQRAKLLGCPVVLGSATPSLEMYHLARNRKIEYLFLPYRIGKSELPEIEIIDMRKVETQRNTSLFSSVLLASIEQNLSSGEQTMIFLNHRGYAQYVQCFRCGETLMCPNCSVNMKYHRNDKLMKCHICGHQADVPDSCPACGSRSLRYFGLGTERVANQLKRKYRDARIERMDRDTTQKKGEYRKIIDAFEHREIDILVGTQMIAKGLDFPGVTLVGVVSADSIISMPDFRAGERTFQLLTQVSGRAGRRDRPGRVIIQTLNPSHPAITAAATQNSLEFYDYELNIRETALYPPFVHMVNFIVTSDDQKYANELSVEVAGRVRREIEEIKENDYFGLLGPAEAPFFKLHGKYRYFVLLRGRNLKKVLKVAVSTLESFPAGAAKNIAIDVHPQNIM
ncbi:MAG TPA: primosomal protein N' [bacterium]|nr:primosomal protein N' [bacterium]